MRKSLVSHYQGRTYRIIEDKPEVGFYVFAYDETGRDTHDYLQDNLQMAKECALHEFGVPLDSWIEEQS